MTMRLIAMTALMMFGCGAWAQDETPASGLDFYGRGLVRDNIDIRFGTDGDIRVMYDETTDDRVEIHDGTNLLGWIKDQGTIADFYFSGAMTVDRGATLNAVKGNYDVAIHGDTVDNILFADASADVVNIIGGTLSLTTDLPVASGGTGVSVLDDVVGTALQITVTNGADSIIGGDVTLSLPSAVTLPGSLAVTTTAAITGNTTMTGDLAVNGADITSTAARLDIASTTDVRIEENTLGVYDADGATSLTITAGGSVAAFNILGYRASSSPIGSNNVYTAGRGTLSAPAVVPSSIILHRFNFKGLDTALAPQPAAYIDILTDSGTIGAADMPGEIQISTTPDGLAAPALAITINSNQTMVGTASWTTAGDMAVNGDDITADGALTIAAGGGTGTITLDEDVAVVDVLSVGAYTLSDIYYANPASLNKGYTPGVAAEDESGLFNDDSIYLSVDSDGELDNSFLEIETQGQLGSGSALLKVSGDGVHVLSGNLTLNAGPYGGEGRISPTGYNIAKGSIPAATTVATGVLTVSTFTSLVVINGEGGAADTLDKLTCGVCGVGDIVMLMSDGDAITITDGFGGGAADSINISAALSLDNIRDSLVVMRINGSIWVEITRANNA